MVLAGGNDQIALIEKLRKRFSDVYIYLVDFAENPVAKPYADEHLCISTMDREAVLKAAREEMIDMIIITCGDQPLPIMAYVAEQLGLPCYLTYNQSLCLTNKMLMKQIMVDNHIPTAKYVVCHEVNDVAIETLNFPLIVKPADCNGSKGVRRVCNIDELQKHLKSALQYSRTTTAIVEEFKTGQEISVDLYVKDVPEILLVSQLNKFFVDNSIQVIYQSLIPAILSEKQYGEIQAIAEKICTAFKLFNCPLLIQLIVNGDEINVIEFSARIGGGAKYQTIQKITGFDILNANIDAFLGIKPIVKINKKNKVYSRCHLYTNGGVFDRISGLDELINEGVINSMTLTKTKGTLLSVPTGSSDRVGSIFVEGDDYEDLKNKIKKAISRIKVYDSFGNDILNREMYEK